MKTYIIYDYDGDYRYELTTDWTDSEISDQFNFNDEDLEDMKDMEVGEMYMLYDLGIELVMVTRVA